MRPDDRPGWGMLLRHRTLRLIVVVELLIALGVGAGLWALRQKTLDAELGTLAALSAAMAAQADGTLDVADAALRATRAELQEGLLHPGADADSLLKARVAALPRYQSLAVFDATGRRVASSAGVPASSGGAMVSRDFFVAAREAKEPGLFVGSPFMSPGRDAPAIGVSMDWRDPQGRFMGAIALLTDPEFLDGDFQRIAPTPDTSLAIYRRDRALVSDGPGDGSAQLLPESALNRLWGGPNPERPQMMTLPDGRSRLVAAHLLHRYPLLVVITRDEGLALADWRDQAWITGAFVLSALAVTLLLSVRNVREQALRQAADDALAAEQERAVRAFAAAQEGHWEWDAVARERHGSPRMRELLALPAEENDDNGHHPFETPAVHPDDDATLRTRFAALLDGTEPLFDITFRVRRDGGLWRHVRARGQAWRDAQGRVQRASGTAIDISSEVEAQAQALQLENQLQRARKLEALGTLAGGEAHDFNNILAAVIGFSELARDAAAPASAQARQLDQVLQAGQRGKSLVERILAFSRNTPRPHTTFLLQPVIEEVLTLLTASLTKRVEVHAELLAPGIAVRGDATMVYEAATNLCTNAIQAMQPAGGTLHVRLRSVVLTEPLALFDRQIPAGRYASLEVQDDGPGIQPAVMSRLFEPFFTTKGEKSGTGLGLAVVHGVMADMRGAIHVTSVPGEGACFTLYFPESTEPLAPQEAADAPLPIGQGQTVLVVDDEAALVQLAEELLAELGYEPVGFSSSTEALEELRQDPHRFDLLLTDQIMPDLSGTALAVEVRKIRPDLPIVMASGYGGEQLQQRALDAGVALVVNKPLTRAQLAQALKQVLGTR